VDEEPTPTPIRKSVGVWLSDCLGREVEFVGENPGNGKLLRAFGPLPLPLSSGVCIDTGRIGACTGSGVDVELARGADPPSVELLNRGPPNRGPPDRSEMGNTGV